MAKEIFGAIILVAVLIGGMWYYSQREVKKTALNLSMDNSEESGEMKSTENKNNENTNTNTMNNTGTKETGEVKELKIEDLVIGTGAEAVAGKKISVLYKGTLVDGTVFDASSLHGNAPFEFTLGAGQVIGGWDQGFSGMKVGGKRRLTIPSDLGYGATGAGASIPPNAALIFEVELLGVK